MDSQQTGITNQTSGVMEFLTEENLKHWIKSKTSEEITRIKNYETTIQQDEHGTGLSAIDKRNCAEHFNPGSSFRNELTMEGFYNWYNQQVKGIHPITNDAFDRITAEHFN